MSCHLSLGSKHRLSVPLKASLELLLVQLSGLPFLAPVECDAGLFSFVDPLLTDVCPLPCFFF